MKLDLVTGRGMSERQLEARRRMRDVRTMVKALCCREGALVTLMPFYMAFGMQLDKIKRQELDLQSAAMEAEVYRAMWVARGLSTRILEAIRTELFDIPSPVP